MTIKPTHPRIWITDERLTRMKARMAANDPRWQSFKATCDQYLNFANPYGSHWYGFSLMYLLTGDGKWANKAVEMVRPLAQAGVYALTNSVAGVGQASREGYNVREVLPALAVTYDWCYPAMSDADRKTFEGALIDDCRWVWPDTNSSREDAWSIRNPGDNFYHGFLMGTWLANLALGSVGAARDRDRWVNEVLPHMVKYQKDGYLLEGTSYGMETLGRIMQYLDAHATATGENLVNTPWPATAPDILPHLTTPTGDHIAPLGDQAREKEGTLADPHRLPALIGQNYRSDALLPRWLGNVKPNRQAWSWDQWQELLWGGDPPANAMVPAPFANHNGGVIVRSSWARDATALYVQCGPGRESHQDRAQGSFLLFKNDWLAAKAGLWGGNGILRDTLYHNCVLCPPFDQPEFAQQHSEPVIQDALRPYHENGVKVGTCSNTTRYTYIRMGLSGAYAYYKWADDPAKRVTQPLAEYTREMFFVKPDILIVFDRIKPADPNQELIWTLNTRQQPAVMPPGYKATGLSGQSLLPATADIYIRTVAVNQGPGGAVSSWRTEIRPATRGTETQFLQVLSLEVAPTPATLYRKDNLVGAKIGNVAWCFRVDGSSGSGDQVEVIVGGEG